MTTKNNAKKMAAKVFLSGALALAGLAMASGTAHAWNPQPDPPKNPSHTYDYTPHQNPTTSFTTGDFGGFIGPIGPAPNGSN